MKHLFSRDSLDSLGIALIMVGVLYAADALGRFEVVNTIGDLQAQSYIALGTGAATAVSAENVAAAGYLPETLADRLVGGFADMLTWYAQVFIDGVYVVGDAQAYGYIAIHDTLDQSTQTMGAAVAQALERGVGGSADAAAVWYRQGSARVEARLQGAR